MAEAAGPGGVGAREAHQSRATLAGARAAVDRAAAGFAARVRKKSLHVHDAGDGRVERRAEFRWPKAHILIRFLGDFIGSFSSVQKLWSFLSSNSY